MTPSMRLTATRCRCPCRTASPPPALAAGPCCAALRYCALVHSIAVHPWRAHPSCPCLLFPSRPHATPHTHHTGAQATLHGLDQQQGPGGWQPGAAVLRGACGSWQEPHAEHADDHQPPLQVWFVTLGNLIWESGKSSGIKHSGRMIAYSSSHVHRLLSKIFHWQPFIDHLINHTIAAQDVSLQHRQVSGMVGKWVSD